MEANERTSRSTERTPSQRSRGRRRPLSCSTVTLPPSCLFLLLLLSLYHHHRNTLTVIVDAREADERSRFLYGDDPRASIILEYQLHNAPSRDYSGDERSESAKHAPGNEYDEERHIKPYFLMAGESNGPRVVQFYSPWCGHCQTFKPRYVALAKEVYARLPDDQPEINFHAVSCSVHHWVCMQNRVKDYPTVVAYKSQSSDPIRLKHLKADVIAEAVGVRLKSAAAAGTTGESYGYETSEAMLEGGHGTGELNEDGSLKRPVDILGASLDGLARTREAVYRDAALSFTYALKTGIFLQHGGGSGSGSAGGNDWEQHGGHNGEHNHHGGGGGGGGNGPLDPEKREAFSEWINLLYWTLPPTWQLHTLINDVRNNLHSVTSSPDNMDYIVDQHLGVVNGKHVRWSEQCSKGVDGAGYPCGLWSLLHIVSVGVAERHKAVLGSLDHVTTRAAADVVRDYVANFFGCEICREHFVHMYDSCGFDHCRRFKQPKNMPPEASWNEFALWLWEVHNDVNTKLAEAEAKREGRILSKKKARYALWPSERACPECMNDKGVWNKNAVLEQLKKEYWPGGVQNFRFVVLRKKDTQDDEEESGSGFFSSLLFFSAPIAFLIWCAKKQHLAATGRHKKYEPRYERSYP